MIGQRVSPGCRRTLLRGLRLGAGTRGALAGPGSSPRERRTTTPCRGRCRCAGHVGAAWPWRRDSVGREPCCGTDTHFTAPGPALVPDLGRGKACSGCEMAGRDMRPRSPHTLFFAGIEGPDGNLMSWGSRGKGETGVGSASTENQLQPLAVALPTGAAPECVATGWESTAIAVKQGGVLVCGANERNQLGVGEEAARPVVEVPTPVPGLAGRHILSLSCGWRHMAAVDDRGAVLCWGEGRRGALGQGPGVTAVAAPAEVALDSPARQVACGWQHTIAVGRDGSLWAWGCHKHGQCGVGDRASPRRAGPVVWTPAAVRVPVFGPGGEGCGAERASRVVDVAVGWSHALALVEPAERGGGGDGGARGVLAWGRNTFGQLGACCALASRALPSS